MYKIPSKIYYNLTQSERNQIKAQRQLKLTTTKRFKVFTTKDDYSTILVIPPCSNLLSA